MRRSEPRGPAAALLAALGLAAALAQAAPSEGDPAGRLARLGHDKHAELVRRGHAIFTDTPRHARRYSGNRLSCGNCHLGAGTRPQAAPMWAAWGEYPAFSAKNDRVVSFEERVQDCFRYSLNGFAPPLDSEELRALVAYAQWLARGVTVGANPPGRGFPTIARTGADPNPLRGRDLYTQRCAACHGAQGDGRVTDEPAARVPPLWGLHSFNRGAGLQRLDLMAGFLKANMPLGNPDLSDQDALDIAAWIGLQERWPDPRKGLLRGLVEP
ncbi:MAG: c-type cytochrome [Piscinibacter sp.]|uniref:c-type cytochrome n=1 Tax=Piscinibacter TaxID=1114981 RepID=UPI000FDEE269|nr:MULTISPECIES: c-type cytochrome [Piscinibacter]MCW5667482.1 c-type cytochrome [Piscinibacter sp.]